MVIRWKGPAQHLDQALVRPGDTIEVPEEVARPWLRDGDAEEVKSKKAAKKTGGEEN